MRWSGLHTDVVWSLALDPLGKHVASAGSDGEVILWDMETGKPIRKMEEDTTMVAIAFSPDGNRLASVGIAGENLPTDARITSSEVILWDVATGRRLLALPLEQRIVTGVAFSPDGKRIATAGSDHLIRIQTVSPP